MRNRLKNCKNVNYSTVLSTPASEKGNKTVTVQLPISNEHGFPVLADYLAKVEQMFNLEKNIKNSLYAFISSMGLDDKLREYAEKYPLSSPDGHQRAINNLFINNTSKN